MDYNQLLEVEKSLYCTVDKWPQSKQEAYGEKALEAIGDYPLYGATSNITYTEAILIASMLGIKLKVKEKEGK